MVTDGKKREEEWIFVMTNEVSAPRVYIELVTVAVEKNNAKTSVTSGEKLACTALTFVLAVKVTIHVKNPYEDNESAKRGGRQTAMR